MDFEDFLPLILGLLYFFFSQKSSKRKKQQRLNRQSQEEAGSDEDRTPQEADEQRSRSEPVGNYPVREGKKGDSEKNPRSAGVQRPQRADKEEDEFSFDDFWTALSGEEKVEEEPEQRADHRFESISDKAAGKPREAFSTSGADDDRLAAALRKPREERTAEEEAQIRRQQTHRIGYQEEKGPEVEASSGGGIDERSYKSQAYRRARGNSMHPLLGDLQDDPRKAIILSEVFQRKG